MTDGPQASPEQVPAVDRAETAPQPVIPEQPTIPAPPASVEQTECSRAGCREVAIWALRWRNPRIHAADRRKTWVACDEHVVYLREFLSARDFPVEVGALAARPA